MSIAVVRRIGRAYALSFVAWSALSLLAAWQYHLFDQDLNIRIPLFVRVALAESNGFSSALLTPLLFWIVRRNSESARPRLAWVVYGIALGPFMLAHSAILWLLYSPWRDAVRRYIPRIANGPLELIRSSFANQVTTFLAIIVAAYAYVYFDRVRRQELERHEFQQALAASELQSLKLQLHPRFVFSALDGIAGLVETDRRTAKHMIVKLSTLLRTALQHGGSDLITLDKELEFVREYVDLERMRLGGTLTVDWSIAPDTRAILVPQLILQPLVESAMGDAGRGHVEIASRRDGRTLEISVRGGTGASAETAGNLQNAEARLQHLYAGEAALLFDADDPRGATSKVRVPALGLDFADVAAS